jgi:acetolactate synthase-1/2/3 large subunit
MVVSENTGGKTARSGAQCVIEGLEKGGCELLFGYPGGGVLDIFNALVLSPIHFILSRHEQGAVHMADGYARATGKPGCCLVTSGPGATNTITGLATANMDGIPLVCIAGQVPLSMIGNDAFQEADTTGITRPVTKHNYLVRSVDDLPRILAEAFYIATTGKPGPVLVDIPKDVQRQLTTAQTPAHVSMRGYNPVVTLDPEPVRRLAEAINRAERPVLYVGGGTITGNAAAPLTELARKAHIPVTTTLMGLGTFPEDDPLALRMLGMHGSVAANMAVSQCDLLVSVGARFDDRVTGKVSQFAPLATIAHIDIDRASIGKAVKTQIGVLGQTREVLEALLPLVNPAVHQPWCDQVQQWKTDHPFAYTQDGDVIMPQFVIEQIHAVSRGQALIVTDVGQHQMWSAHHYKYVRPRTFISSAGLGTMGFGLPAAIGAQFGRPDALVVTITGDGSIQMNFQELVVAVEHDLPIKVVILNNTRLGMVRQWQEMFYNKRYSAVMMSQQDRPQNERIEGRPAKYLPDFVMLAEAHGACATRVTRPAEVVPALQKAFASPRPWVIECMVSPDANVYPIIPPGASLTEMVKTVS